MSAHLGKFQIYIIFRVDGCTCKGLLISSATFYKRHGKIYKPFPNFFFPKVKTKKLCTKSMHIVS